MKMLGIAALVGALIVGCGAAAAAGPTAASGATVRAVASEPTSSWLDPPVALDLAAAFERPMSAWGAGHRGVDLYATEAAPVRSPGEGIVTFAGDVAGRGVVVVLHPSGLRSTLEPVVASVSVGDRVNAGAIVGAVEVRGTHCAPRACLHWGVRRGDEYVDPLDVLRGYGPIRLLPLMG